MFHQEIDSNRTMARGTPRRFRGGVDKKSVSAMSFVHMMSQILPSNLDGKSTAAAIIMVQGCTTKKGKKGGMTWSI